MKFRSEEERLAHPQARLIPSALCGGMEIFSIDEITDLEIEVMKKGLSVLAEANVSAVDKKGKMRLWCAFAVSHPNSSDAEWRQCAKLLNIHILDYHFVDDMLHIASGIGNIWVLNQLATSLQPAELQEKIIQTSYPRSALELAALGGHLAFMNRLVDLAGDKLQDMIAYGNFSAFRQAAWGGHLAVINRLADLAGDKLQDMIAVYHFSAFVSAVSHGHLAVINRLIELAGDKLQDMIQDVIIAQPHASAFYQAAAGGHLAVINRLVELAGDKLQDMIAAGNFSAFVGAASHGHLAVINRLVELAGDKLQDMIAADNFSALRGAARRESNRLHFSGIYQGAREEARQAVVNRLLSFPAVFAYAETHDEESRQRYFEYSLDDQEQAYDQRHIHPFVTERLADLHRRRAEFIETYPNAVFDLADSEEVKLCFYMLRNLIRRNDPTLLDEMHFLIEIPAVKTLLHTAVTPAEPNELLRLALAVNNRGAAEILLTIPAVRDLATQNDFYRAENRGELDLRALATDSESSMRALSAGEQQRFAQAMARYQPMLIGGGVDRLMQALRDQLMERYAAHPAEITQESGQRCQLPADWQAFQVLNLTEKERGEALRAYYTHPDHTAWRYLAKPNPWMSADASYINVDPSHPTERWSTFDEYQSLIAMLYLAATDTDPAVAPTDEHTIEGRLTHFIAELALIGRAHNWDDTRVKMDKAGHPVLDSSGKPVREEYDNQQGDKPSCFSGVKRRLFQSVISHPLLDILTRERVLQEVRDFVRAHFIKAITPSNRADLKTAWKNYISSLEPEDTAPFKALDISPTQQQALQDHLCKKYGAAFSEEPHFVREVSEAFEFTQTDPPAHALKFSAMIGLEQLLKTPSASPSFWQSEQPARSSRNDGRTPPSPRSNH
ncbi:MAG: hypothetical protein HY939_05420 [Gammaproteobacteria bacterium]|nr:hypothetical protein [Gammaproteobacteria bacterium]